MTELLMRRTLGGLAPDDEASTSALRRIKAGEVVKVELVRPRSHRNLRRWWALMGLIHQNSEQFKSPEQAHDYVKILAGHCSQIVSQSTGEVYLVADSISFGRMGEDEFQQVWMRAKDAVREHILPAVEIATIENEIAQLAS